MDNLTGLSLSLLYIFTILGLAALVAKYSQGASETSRKLVHILVGNWVFLTPLFHDLWAVILIPFSFILINSLSLKYKLIKAMERNDDSLGTVYYAISLFILSGAGFILGWRTLPYIGILTMAYGDGLAAVVGQKWGHRKPFSFAPNKTLAGSMTVFFASLVVSAAALYIFREDARQTQFTIPLILFVSFLTATVSTFIELVGHKGCDNLTLPVGSALFATLSIQFASPGYFLYLFVSVAILITAYRLKSITTDGMVAALLTAVTLYALGGVWIASALLVFFILGSIVSRLKNDVKKAAEALQEDTGARNWKQVLANSLPAAVLLWIYLFYPGEKIFLFLAFTVFSAAASDTFSSEIGMMSKGRVFSILTGKSLPKGVSGGVTVSGLLAGLLGSVLLSLMVLPQFGLTGFIAATLLGCSGSLIDSILGASIQRKYLSLKGHLQDKENSRSERPYKGIRFITNNAVNLITLILVPILGYLLLS